MAWRKTLGGEFRVQARTRAANGTFSPITTLSAAGQPGFQVAGTISTTGDIGPVAWIRSDGTRFRAQLRRLVAGAWQPVETVSPANVDVNDVRLGLSANGATATLVFATVEEAIARVRGRTRRADGSYGPADIVSANNGETAESPELAVNGAGRAVAAWQQLDDGTRLIWTGANFIP